MVELGASVMIKEMFKRLSPKFQMFTGVYELRKGNAILQAQEYDRIRSKIMKDFPDHPALEGYKVYSQTDEDGIIDGIFRKIPNSMKFVEIGVQSGIECNSLLLLLKNWEGVWIEGSVDHCRLIEKELGGRQFGHRFRLDNSFVTRDNIASLLRRAMNFLETEDLDLLSIDIDGNDIYCLDDALRSGIRPKVVCVEYNAKFPPGVNATIEYHEDHVWDESDYMGSSLEAINQVLSEGGYRLITCNIPGVNAFFVRQDLAAPFPVLSLREAYQPFRFYLSPIVPAQPPSLRYLRKKLLAKS